MPGPTTSIPGDPDPDVEPESSPPEPLAEPTASESSPAQATEPEPSGAATAPEVARRLAARAPVIILGAAIAFWVGLFAVHLHYRQLRFATPDQDLAIWDQAVWLLAHGHSFMTVRGLDVFGFHASPALYVFVPFYWLGAGPDFLNFAQVTVLSLGAVAVFRLARHYLAHDWQALILALAFLGNFAAQWMVYETFHPEVMAITPLLFAYLAAVEGRWKAFAAWLVFAVMWKEDVALVGLMLGLILAIRGTRTITRTTGPSATRRVGVFTMAGCLIWFLAATRVVIPAFTGEGNFTEALYGDLGASPTEMIQTAFTHPDRYADHLGQSKPHHYVFELSGSYGFAPLLAPLALLMALPQALINLLAIYNFFWTTRVHYAAIPLFAMTVAAVEGVARWRRPPVRLAVLGLVLVGAVYTGASWGISPVSPKYRDGYWPLTPIPQQHELDAAIALPAGGDSVSTMFNLAPHLSHRRAIYTFPNPWIPNNWGVHDENRPDPDTVDWIIVNPQSLNDLDRGVLVSALVDPSRRLERGEQPIVAPAPNYEALVDRSKWQVIVDQPGLLIVHRREPSR